MLFVSITTCGVCRLGNIDLFIDSGINFRFQFIVGTPAERIFRKAIAYLGSFSFGKKSYGVLRLDEDRKRDQ
jgi:hypothetical protein